MKILNYGSLNIDDTYQVGHIVRPGETLTSQSMERFPGGKGLNQSVALARAGANVWHGGCIGADGVFLKQLCAEAGADVSLIREIDAPTGHAIIQVDENGQNSIVLYPGTNRMQRTEWLREAVSPFERGDWLLLQNEVNGIGMLMEMAKEKGMKIALNPSPFDEKVAECPLALVDLFLLNEVEGEQLTGEKEPGRILDAISRKWPHAATVLTLGPAGSIYRKDGITIRQEAYPADAADTTGAGDTYTGYFLAGLLQGDTPEKAMSYAAMAASIAVTRKGAAVSIPVRSEVEKKLSAG